MPQEKIDQLGSIILSVIAGTSFGFSIKQADLYASFLLTVVSIISVIMLIVINRKRFIKEMRKLLNNCPDDEIQEK